MYVMQIKHWKKVCKDFKMKKLGECNDFYVQSDTLFVADLFDNFQNRCFDDI